MYYLNRAELIGNVTRDPELKTTQSGQNVTSFSIATNRYWKDAAGQKQERAEFHNVVAWGKLAEICTQYLAKGRKVYACGRLQTREWETSDGQKRMTTEIILDDLIILDKKPGGGHEAPPAPGPESAPPARPQEEEVKVEDIPF